MGTSGKEEMLSKNKSVKSGKGEHRILSTYAFRSPSTQNKRLVCIGKLGTVQTALSFSTDPLIGSIDSPVKIKSRTKTYDVDPHP